LADLIACRHARGLDTHDETWDGDYHMAPAAHPYHGYVYEEVADLLRPLARRAGLVRTAAFNLGEPSNFRVPDGGLHRTLPRTVFVTTAAVVIEIESPDDETWDKLSFYASHRVDEVLIVSAESGLVMWLRLEGERYVVADHSDLLGPGSRGLARGISWPPRG
jgi:Uma2 family endonuclease